jgi:hypothetical protein
MFGRKPTFEPDGLYDGYGYRVLDSGKVLVNFGDHIATFKSVDEMVEALDRASMKRAAQLLNETLGTENAAPPPLPKTQKRSERGCGCLTILVLIGLIFVYFSSGGTDKSKIAGIINSQFGAVCQAKVEGTFSDTLRVDWKGATTKINALAVMAAIGKSKEAFYSKGIRYFKYPNESGTYNVIDWKTGDKSSISERAPYYFH